MTPAEEAALRPLCHPDFWDLIEAALLTGMREGELIHLTRAQVDLENRLLKFPPTKRGRKRLMPVNERLFYLLVRRCAGLAPTALVFSLKGRPWLRWHIQDRMERATRKAGVVNFRFHDLRHTAASRLRRSGHGGY